MGILNLAIVIPQVDRRVFPAQYPFHLLAYYPLFCYGVADLPQVPGPFLLLLAHGWCNLVGVWFELLHTSTLADLFADMHQLACRHWKLECFDFLLFSLCNHTGDCVLGFGTVGCAIRRWQ